MGDWKREFNKDLIDQTIKDSLQGSGWNTLAYSARNFELKYLTSKFQKSDLKKSWHGITLSYAQIFFFPA